jgi:hypothetical protein
MIKSHLIPEISCLIFRHIKIKDLFFHVEINLAEEIYSSSILSI